jgi:hypothetical protein
MLRGLLACPPRYTAPVSRVRPPLYRFAWLALAGMLGLALAPTLPHSLARWQRDRLALAETCTPQRAVAGGLVREDGSPSMPRQTLGHCPYCALGATASALPSALRVAFNGHDAGAAVPPSRRQAPRTLAVRIAAQPRAPPLQF